MRIFNKINFAIKLLTLQTMVSYGTQIDEEIIVVKKHLYKLY